MYIFRVLFYLQTRRDQIDLLWESNFEKVRQVHAFLDRTLQEEKDFKETLMFFLE